MKRLFWLFLLLLVLGSVYWIFQRELHHQYDLQVVGEITLSGVVTTHSDNYLLVGQGNTLHMVAFTPPAILQEVSTIRVDIHIEVITVAGHYVYLFDLEEETFSVQHVRIINISDPQVLKQIKIEQYKSVLSELTYPNTFDITKFYYYSKAFTVITTNDAKPLVKESFSSPNIKVGKRQAGCFMDVGIITEGNTLYYSYQACDRPMAFYPDLRGVAIFNISNPLKPSLNNVYHPHGKTYYGDTIRPLQAMSVLDKQIYLISNIGDGLYVINASNPNRPFETAHYDIQGTDVEVIGEYVLVKVDADRWQVLQMQPRWGFR